MSLPKILAALAAVVTFSGVAAAQSTPTPPLPSTPPTPVVAPTPAPLPPMEPMEPMEPTPATPSMPPLPALAPTRGTDVDFDFNDFDIPIPDIRFEMDLDRVKELTRTATRKAMTSIDVDAITRTATSAATDAIANLDIDRIRDVSLVATARAMSKISTATARIAPAISTSLFDMQFSSIASTPAAAWASNDPADSLYRAAREALNRGEYRRASQLFDQIAQRYPNSAYAGDSRYWKAFALYRIGSADDLREALKTLQSGSGRLSQALQVDAPTLATRINGALAARGDANAQLAVVHDASTASGCDREDIAVRVEALNSLGQMDPASTTPMLKRLLEKKDDCSASLRRAALFLLAKRGDPEAFALLTNTAKTDPDMRLRADAIRWLARLPGDQAIPTLEDIVRTSDNSDLQQAAIEALSNSDSPRARLALRSLIERTDVSENLRAEALGSLDADHVDDGGAYLRSIYPKLETPRLQQADVRSIARIGGPDNEQWLLALVGNNSTSLDVRRTALGYAGRTAININDLVKMYDSMADRPLREQLIALYARRTEPQATDKLIDIAKNGTDPELRRLAISYLSRKNDARTKQLLLEIIDK